METMTFDQFMTFQNLRGLLKQDGSFAIIKANGKVLKRKSDGKLYEGYKNSKEALADLEKDLIEAGVLTAI